MAIEAFNRETMSAEELELFSSWTRTFLRETRYMMRNFVEGEPYPESAIDNAIYDGYLEGNEDAENKRLLVGFDRKGNPLEIYYNILDEDTVRVFHAMEYRNIHSQDAG